MLKIKEELLLKNEISLLRGTWQHQKLHTLVVCLKKTEKIAAKLSFN